MSHNSQLPYVAVVATTTDQRPTSVRNLAHAPGLLHPRCPAAPMGTSQRRGRARRGRHGWIYLILAHSTCDGCPHHPRNEYGTWIAEALGFDWRAWAGYLYGPLVMAAQWGTRRSTQPGNVSTDLYPIARDTTDYARRRWDHAQAELLPHQRATHRLEQWHAQQAWQHRHHAVTTHTHQGITAHL